MLRSSIPIVSLDLPKIIMVCSKRLSTEVKEASLVDDVLTEENNLQREETIERKRNKSGLRKSDYRLLHGQVPYDEPIHWLHTTVKYQRKLYGVYGESSGIDPRLCWMDKKEFAMKLEYDSLAEDHTIPETIAEIKEKKRKEKEATLERDADVARKVACIQEWKMELQRKIAKKEAETNAAKAKKEKLIEEVRRHFGFKVDPKDERFKEMLEKKEKEQKKAEKIARKSAKEAQMLEILKQQSQGILNSVKQQTSEEETKSKNVKEEKSNSN